MKRTFVLTAFLAVAMVMSVMAQAPAAGGQGRGGGARGQVAPATGPIADMVNAVVVAYNKQDAAFFEKHVAPGTLWLDEDGHFVPATTFIGRAMQATPAKTLSISGLRVQDWGDAGWAAFAYEVATPQGPVRGLNSMVFKKNGADWQVVLVHGAVNTKISHE